MLKFYKLFLLKLKNTFERSNVNIEINLDHNREIFMHAKNITKMTTSISSEVQKLWMDIDQGYKY